MLEGALRKKIKWPGLQEIDVEKEKTVETLATWKTSIWTSTVMMKNRLKSFIPTENSKVRDSENFFFKIT